MVGTLASSDQDIDAGVTTLSNRARFWLLTVAALDVLLVISSMVALNAALPDIALQTAATQTQLTWIIDGYTLVLACLLLPAGAMGDRFGRRGALLVGLAIFAIASLSPTLFDSPAQIIVARAIAGVGAAFIMPATLSLLTAAFPKSERNKAGWRLGRCGEFRSDCRVHGHGVAAEILFVAIHLLRVRGRSARPVRLHVHDRVVARRNRDTSRLDRSGAHRRRRRGFRVRRRGSAGARLDESDCLGLHVGRCFVRRCLRGGQAAAQAPPTSRPGPSASRSCSSPTSDSFSFQCSTCS